MWRILTFTALLLFPWRKKGTDDWGYCSNKGQAVSGDRERKTSALTTLVFDSSIWSWIQLKFNWVKLLPDKTIECWPELWRKEKSRLGFCFEFFVVCVVFFLSLILFWRYFSCNLEIPFSVLTNWCLHIYQKGFVCLKKQKHVFVCSEEAFWKTFRPLKMYHNMSEYLAIILDWL